MHSEVNVTNIQAGGEDVDLRALLQPEKLSCVVSFLADQDLLELQRLH